MVASPLGESLAYSEGSLPLLRQPTNRGHPSYHQSAIKLAPLPNPLYPLYSLAIYSLKRSLPSNQYCRVCRQH